MTRPVAEILEQAEREGWPTSYIDAMANHHLCGGITRDYVNRCIDIERSSVATEQQKEQLAALIADRAAQGKSTDAFSNLQDLVEGQVQLPPED